KIREWELRRNIWRFSTRRVALRPMTTTSMEFQPELWQPLNVYVQGALVNYNSINYVSTNSENVGNTPGTSTQFWEAYYGPLVADVWNVLGTTTSPTAYWMGELVYMFVPGPGGQAGTDAGANAAAMGIQVYSS